MLLGQVLGGHARGHGEVGEWKVGGLVFGTAIWIGAGVGRSIVWMRLRGRCPGLPCLCLYRGRGLYPSRVPAHPGRTCHGPKEDPTPPSGMDGNRGVCPYPGCHAREVVEGEREKLEDAARARDNLYLYLSPSLFRADLCPYPFLCLGLG